YKAIVALGEKLDGLLEEGAYIQRGEKTEPVEAFSEVLEWLMAQAEKGISVQRYK
ncbi:MAG: hypothetical protein GWO19_04530, partial [Nitrospinaceae bacterium]|nr:hypothetical protein [Nitrospinaceae bacterium]NIR53939.1 hypothetical protein [Nitrospinaceae bacterium]NIS84357.1 hypothetical protein [Nitrospinaceae bacterium]NIU43442.1 hypothetical protein [Nitrospinaceae bacterium]NIU95565.1 hypothetical protein [Nitrospinaceae bacterium]